MAPGPRAIRVTLREGEKEALEALAALPRKGARVMLRARMILMCANGLNDSEVARTLNVAQSTVWDWRIRFNELRVPAVYGEIRKGAKRKLSDAAIKEVMALSLKRGPKGEKLWSARKLASHFKVSTNAICRILRSVKPKS